MLVRGPRAVVVVAVEVAEDGPPIDLAAAAGALPTVGWDALLLEAPATATAAGSACWAAAAGGGGGCARTASGPKLVTGDFSGHFCLFDLSETPLAYFLMHT